MRLTYLLILVIQKRLIRQRHKNRLYMNGSRISDKIISKTILDKFNQLNAQMKLLDMWKANNYENYPTKIRKLEATENRSPTCAITNGRLTDNDGVKVWNLAPDSIKLFFLFHGDSISRPLAPLTDEYAHKTTAPHKFKLKFINRFLETRQYFFYRFGPLQ